MNILQVRLSDAGRGSIFLLLLLLSERKAAAALRGHCKQAGAEKAPKRSQQGGVRVQKLTRQGKHCCTVVVLYYCRVDRYRTVHEAKGRHLSCQENGTERKENKEGYIINTTVYLHYLFFSTLQLYRWKEILFMATFCCLQHKRMAQGRKS